MTRFARRGFLRSAVVGGVAGSAWAAALVRATDVPAGTITVVGHRTSQVLAIVGTGGAIIAGLGSDWTPDRATATGLVAPGADILIGIEPALPPDLRARSTIATNESNAIRMGDIVLQRQVRNVEGVALHQLDVMIGPCRVVCTDAPAAIDVIKPAVLITPSLPSATELERIQPQALFVNSGSIDRRVDLPLVMTYRESPQSIRITATGVELPVQRERHRSSVDVIADEIA